MHISVTGTWVKWSFEDFFATFHPSENPQSTKTLWTTEAIVFYRSEIKSRNILKMKQAWRQKSETLNRLSLSTVSLEGSSFPSGAPLFQQSFIRFQETLYVVLAGSLGKNIFLFITSDPWPCVFPDFRGEAKRDTDTVNYKMTGKTDAICSYLL